MSSEGRAENAKASPFALCSGSVEVFGLIFPKVRGAVPGHAGSCKRREAALDPGATLESKWSVVRLSFSSQGLCGIRKLRFVSELFGGIRLASANVMWIYALRQGLSGSFIIKAEESRCRGSMPLGICRVMKQLNPEPRTLRAQSHKPLNPKPHNIPKLRPKPAPHKTQ